MTDAELFERKYLNPALALGPISWLYQWFGSKMSSSDTSSTSRTKATLVMDGLTYGEGPRVHEGHLYVSDMFDNCVYKINLETNAMVKRMDFEDNVSGLGWLPNGKMLVVAMTKRLVWCYDETTDECLEYADLTAVTQFRTNDMVVDALGNAYVGNFGFDVSKYLTASCTTTLVRIDGKTQKVHVEATGMFFPNGMVITPDGKTLLVNETMAGVVTAFDRAPATGKLSNRRVWANLRATLDGCCLDAEGCLWIAVPQIGAYDTSGCFVRVTSTGDVVDRIGFGQDGLQGKAIACALATLADGKHMLYCLEAEAFDEKKIKTIYGKKNARIKAIQVDVGPALAPDNKGYQGGYC